MTTPDPAGDDPAPPSLLAVVRALIDDAQTLIEAEAGYWRKAIGFALRRTRSIALLAVLALFFAFFTLMAVVVGLLLALAPLIGAWAAMALVSLVLALSGAGCAWLALRRAKRMMRLLSGTVTRDAP